MRSGAEVVKVRLDRKSSELMPIYVCGLLTDSCAAAFGGFLDKKEQFCASLAAMRVSAALSKVVPQNFRDGRFPDFRLLMFLRRWGFGIIS